MKRSRMRGSGTGVISERFAAEDSWGEVAERLMVGVYLNRNLPIPTYSGRCRIQLETNMSDGERSPQNPQKH